MQSKTSFFNVALLKKNLSRTWIVGLLYFILLFLAMPVNYIIKLSNYEESWEAQVGLTKAQSLYEIMSYFPVAIWAAILAIVIAGITFKYMFFKRDNYMMHAFPVSRKSLYFTGFISSSIVGLAPIILNAIILTFVSIIEGAYVFDGIWYLTLVGVVSYEFFLSLAVFSLMTSGQIVTAIVFYGIFNFLYLMIEVAFRLTASLLLFGLGQAMDGININPWTPVAFIDNNCRMNVFYTYDNLGMVNYFTHSLDGAKYLIGYAIAAVVFIVIGYILYKQKQLETVQDFISVPFLKPVFTVGMSFFISMVAGAFAAGLVDAAKPLSYNAKFTIAIIATLIIGCIVYYATQMMIEKTVRVFSSKKFGFMVGYTAAALVAMLLIRGDVFKIENKVPAADDIAWVGIQSSYTMVFTDEEEINSARELHKNFLKDKKELRDVNILYKDVSGTSVSFKYKLKNGNVVIRNYAVVDTESDQVSSSYLAATEPILDYLNNPNRIKEHVVGNIWDNCDVNYMSFSTYTWDESISDYSSYVESFDYLTEREKNEKFKKVYEAVLKDIDAGKMFRTSFGYNAYDVDNDPLYNDFSFTVHNSEIPYFSDEDTYWDYNWRGNEEIYERNIYVSLTKDCINTLKALKDEGFYTDDDQIVTYSEYYERTGYYDGPILY